MQIDADQSVCPACGADGLELFPVFHHMICAYVGRSMTSLRQSPDTPVRNAAAALYRAIPLAKS